MGPITATLFCNEQTSLCKIWELLLYQLHNLESTHPGVTAEIEALTTVRRNTICIGQVMDLEVEQTYIKNYKIAGNYTI